MELLKEVCKDLSEIFDELFKECMRGMKTEYKYKEIPMKEKVEFDDQEIGPQYKKKLFI